MGVVLWMTAWYLLFSQGASADLKCGCVQEGLLCGGLKHIGMSGAQEHTAGEPTQDALLKNQKDWKKAAIYFCLKYKMFQMILLLLRVIEIWFWLTVCVCDSLMLFKIQFKVWALIAHVKSSYLIDAPFIFCNYKCTKDYIVNLNIFQTEEATFLLHCAKTVQSISPIPIGHPIRTKSKFVIHFFLINLTNVPR